MYLCLLLQLLEDAICVADLAFAIFFAELLVIVLLGLDVQFLLLAQSESRCLDSLGSRRPGRVEHVLGEGGWHWLILSSYLPSSA